MKLLKLRILILAILFSVLAAQPALASSVGVHLHGQPGTSASSNKIVADIYGGSSYYITSFVIDATLQPGDQIIVYLQTYEQFNSGSNEAGAQVEYYSNESFPQTFYVPGNDVFAAWLELRTSSNSDGCSIAYFSQMTNSSGNTRTFDPIICDDGGGTEPPPPPPPPTLPPPPSIPQSPNFNIVQPSMPSISISIPGPGSFDGSYTYQEPARQGAFIYTPPPLDIPEPIPSPPPPPQGPGLFDFSSIMQPLGIVENQQPIEQPIDISKPVNYESPISISNPIPQAPALVEENPISTSDPKLRQTPGTIGQPNVSEPITISPPAQPEAPLNVQPAVIDPAVVQEPINMDSPLTQDVPLMPEPPGN